MAKKKSVDSIDLNPFSDVSSHIQEAYNFKWPSRWMEAQFIQGTQPFCWPQCQYDPETHEAFCGHYPGLTNP